MFRWRMTSFRVVTKNRTGPNFLMFRFLVANMVENSNLFFTQVNYIEPELQKSHQFSRGSCISEKGQEKKADKCIQVSQKSLANIQIVFKLLYS